MSTINRHKPYVCLASEVPGLWAGDWLAVTERGTTAARTRDLAYSIIRQEGSMPSIDVPERNKQVKALLKRTFPSVPISVKAGRGTAYHWIEITFGVRVPSSTKAIEDLIIGSGIRFSTYPGDGFSGGGNCIAVTMPREEKAS